MNWVGGARVGAHRLASALLSQQQGVPRADSAPQTKTSMCTHTHTHTHTCCMHPPHAHTSPYTDLHKNRHTHALMQAHTGIPMCAHTHTQAHTYLCGLAGSQTHLHANMCRRTRHTQCWKHHPHLIVHVIYFERTSLPQSWSTSANSANFREPGPSGSQPFLLPPEGATTKPMEPQSSTSQDPHGPVLGRAFQGHRRPSSHIFKTFGSQFSPKLEDDRTCPCLYHETEGSGGCSRTFSQEEVGAAAAGDGAGQA